MNVVLGDPESPRGGVSARSILNVLQSELPTILEPGNIFMQDNARVHTAVLVQDWLRDFTQENGCEILGWPPYSPDLNPIENVWALLKEKIIQHHPELEDMTINDHLLNCLETAAVECWEEFEQDLFYHLLTSMPRRIAAVIRSRGWYTKY